MRLLAAGVAHEVNNPLAAVLANLEFVLGMLGPLAGVDPRVERALAAIVDAADAAARIRDVTRDLRVFARADSDQRTPAVELATVLDAAIRIAQNEIRHRARLVREFVSSPVVAVDEPRLTQVFVNLLVNAAHAIPEGRADQHTIVVRLGADQQGRAVVDVVDDGEGMTAEVRARIFEPFFTTKPAGFGTGLGLAICRRIVEAHGGEIDVESTPGAGTRVRVVLPATLAQRVAVERAPEPPSTARSRILVVDDDAVVASAVARILEADHVVDVATSSNDALDRIRAGARYDAIVCDVMMPNTTGMECHAEIERLDPALARRMVFVTGGAFTPAAQAFLERAQNPKLEKPLDRRALAAALAKVMTPPAT
jgi:CheY-like chemotaxis protein